MRCTTLTGACAAGIVLLRVVAFLSSTTRLQQQPARFVCNGVRCHRPPGEDADPQHQLVVVPEDLEAQLAQRASRIKELEAQVERALAGVQAKAADVHSSTPRPLRTPPTPSRPAAAKRTVALDNSRVLTADDVVRRIPRGELAFVSLANSAYSDLAINWALVLLPVLERAGAAGHAVLAALDEPAVHLFTSRGLPTMRCALGGMNVTGGGKKTHDFRWDMGSFRAMGVSKAELIVWLLRAGRHVCISDVDSVWIAPPHALLGSLPEADVMLGTDCLDVPWDADRSSRQNKVHRCGHQPGSTWSAWFNTGVMLWRDTPSALAMAVEWRDRMAEVKGDGSVGGPLTSNPNQP